MTELNESPRHTNERCQLMPIIDTPAEGFPLPTMDPPSRRLRDVAARLTPGGRARAMQRADVVGVIAEAALSQPNATAQRIAERIALPLTDAKFEREVRAAFVEPHRPESWPALRDPRDARNGVDPAPDLFDREVGIGRTRPAWYVDGATVHIWPQIPTEPVATPVFDLPIAERLARPRFDQGGALSAWRADDVLTTGQIGDYVRAAREQEEALLRASFDAGRAYQRGDTLRRGAGGKSLGSRRVQAQGIATDYLRDDPERGALHAAMVLAGFLGQDPATVTP